MPFCQALFTQNMAEPGCVGVAPPVEVSGGRLCLFRWRIHPPFVPGQRSQARFYHQVATVTEWLVTLQFEERRVGEWEILLTLALDTWREERKEICAKTVAVGISLAGTTLALREDKKYRFNAANRYEYFLRTNAQMFAQMEKQHPLVAVLGVSLHEEGRAEDEREEEDQQEDSRLVSRGRDLMCLSDDLRHLANVALYSNVELRSSDGKFFRAHAFMLMVRWRNFFKRHSFNTVAHTVVRTNISADLLKDLLDYMYSGNLPGNFPEGSRPSYKAELFQVIDWYGIQHLYRVLVGRASLQEKASKKPALSLTLDFRLQYVSDAPVLNASMFLHPQQLSSESDVRFHRGEFKFQIQVNNANGVGAWLSYAIWSKCDSRVYAQVVLKVTKMGLGTDNERVLKDSIIAHARNYTIEPNQSVASGPALFLGCIETFGHFPSESPSGKIEQWFRLDVCLADGTSLDQLQNRNTFSNNFLERIDLLSNHMYELLRQELHVDMRLESRLALDADTRAVQFVHRAILRTRVPRLYGLLVNYRPDQMLPNTAAVRLSEEALSSIVSYIYTGKLLVVPQHMLDQISDFAIRSEFYVLADYVRFLRGEA